MERSPLDLRVAHVGDVAGVGSALVTQARATGHRWMLYTLPAVRGPLVPAAARRAVDGVRWLRTRPGADVVHVHYGPNGYYGWGTRTPYVLHMHGSDVRMDLHRPVARELTLLSLRNAAAVLYSTQDLAGEVTALRPDAQWLPNPLSLEALEGERPGPVSGRVVFSSRWDSTKGGEALVDAVAALVADGVEVHGVSWGVLAPRAQAAGARLHPLMTRPAFLDLMASAEVVVGQHSFGVPGMTELQAMALGRPVVMQAPGTPVIASTTATLPERVRWALNHPRQAEQTAERARAWCLATHAPSAAVERLDALYTRLAG